MQHGIIRAAGKVLAAVPAQVAHPLGPPVPSGTTITVETMLNQPTRLTQMIMDLSLQRFIAEYVFTSAGGVTGGAVVYDEVIANELYTARDVQRVAPGGEFPLITSERMVPKVAEVEKWGGKVFITREARDRNNSANLTKQLRQLTNTIIRKLNQRAVETMDAAISAGNRTFIGRNWSTVVTGGAGQSNADQWPARDFAYANMVSEQEELGVEYNLWLLNPQEYYRLTLIYGGELTSVLAVAGIELFVSNRIAAGTAIVVARGQLGEMRIEQPLATETWEDADGRQRTWIQSSVRPLWFVDNPYAILKVTGLAG